MRGRKHRPRRIQLARSKIKHVGARQTEIDDINSLLSQPILKRLDKIYPTRTHVMCDDNSLRLREFCERHAERVSESCIKLIGHRAPNVVSLDDCF